MHTPPACRTRAVVPCPRVPSSRLLEGTLGCSLLTGRIPVLKEQLVAVLVLCFREEHLRLRAECAGGAPIPLQQMPALFPRQEPLVPHGICIIHFGAAWTGKVTEID